MRNSGFRWTCVFWLLATIVATSGSQERNLLTSAYPVERLKQTLLTFEQWHPYPRASERRAWTKLPPALRTEYSGRGEQALQSGFPKLTQALYLQYAHTGIRLDYDRPYHERRRKLEDLILAECVEYKGRFLKKIAEGICLLCEEPTWVVPAHLGPLQSNDSLPDTQHPVVDLYASETANLLAWTHYLLGEELDRISPGLTRLIESELKARVLDPNLQREDFWWMWSPGVQHPGRTINNWTSWICSNWLAVTLLIERNEEIRLRTISKIVSVLDRFLNSYPEDGGVDEGPNYWNHSIGSLYETLSLLGSATGKTSSLLSHPLIRNMGRYIYKTHVKDDYFVTISDSPLKISFPSSLAILFGREIHDKALVGLGAALARRQDIFNLGILGSMTRQLMFLFNVNELITAEPQQPLLTDVWLPQSQFMAAREKQNSARGFYLAAQGLHNGKSHNHNDVGNFLLYMDGEPFIIDVGPEGYKAKTFTDERYTIWTMQSAYHNLPTINGAMEKEGKQFAARDVHYQCWRDSVLFSLDIAATYPPEAKVEQWVRSMRLDRTKGSVAITEHYRLSLPAKDVTLSLMTSGTVIRTEADRLVVRVRKNKEGYQPEDVEIRFDARKLQPLVESVKIEDEELRNEWGVDLQRILLKAKDPQLQGFLTVSFHTLGRQDHQKGAGGKLRKNLEQFIE